jgi:hypothetical protein
MNKALFFAAVFIFFFFNGQSQTIDNSKSKLSDKEMQEHLKRVQKSKDKGTVIRDYDTVFNNGVPYCTAFEFENKYAPVVLGRGSSNFNFGAWDGSTLIKVQLQYAGGGSVQTSYIWTFSDGQSVQTTAWKDAWKKLVELNLIDNGKTLNSDAVAKFIKKNK